MVLQDFRKGPELSAGPAEQAGVAIGDVIHGINYEPLEKGLRHTSALLAKAISLAGFVKLQVRGLLILVVVFVSLQIGAFFVFLFLVFVGFSRSVDVFCFCFEAVPRSAS